MLKNIFTVLIALCIVGAILLTAITRPRIKALIKAENNVPKKLIVFSNIGYSLLAAALILAFSMRYV